jgi:hypothetical protein
MELIEMPQWLIDLFEFDYCCECGGDAEDHLPMQFLGHPFAMCKWTPIEKGVYFRYGKVIFIK